MGQDELQGKNISTIIPEFYEQMHYLEEDLKSCAPIAEEGSSSPVLRRVEVLTIENNAPESSKIVDSPKILESSKIIGSPSDAPKKEKFGKFLTSTPIKRSPHKNSILIREGRIWCHGQHSDGSSIAIRFEVRAIEKCDLFSIWIVRDAEAVSLHQLNFSTSIRSPESRISIENEEIQEIEPMRMEKEASEIVCGKYAENYHTMKQIGIGGYGSVRLAARKSDGLLVVTKFITKATILKDSWQIDPETGTRIPIELILLGSLKHPNIIKMFDWFENDRWFQAVLELHGCGIDLFEFIERKPVLDEPLTSYIFSQIASAVGYLHSKSIAHCDIKDENILIDEFFTCKLIDFGSAVYVEKGKVYSTFAGTVEYSSPEVLTGHSYSGPELDVWGLGIVLYTIYFGENPFPSAEDAIEAHLNYSFSISDSFHVLLSWMLQPDPNLRATIAEVEDFYWTKQKIQLKDYDFAKVLKNLQGIELPTKRFLYELINSNENFQEDEKFL